VPQRVVDLLEAVKIKHEHREIGASPARDGKGELQALPQQDAVWQIGQRVMMGHMRDLGLGPALLGDVLVRRHPAATGHRLPRNADQSTIGELVDSACRDVAWQRIQGRHHLCGAVIGAGLEDAVADAMLDDFAV
jgi:hypothetical protein